MKEKIKAKFEMSLWHRIRAASILWWSIVITGELECFSDEDYIEDERGNLIKYESR